MMQNFKVSKLQWHESITRTITDCGLYSIQQINSGEYYVTKNKKETMSEFFKNKEAAMKAVQDHLVDYVEKSIDEYGNVKPLEWSNWHGNNYLVSDCNNYFITECFSSDYLYATAHGMVCPFNFRDEDLAKEFLNSWHKAYILSAIEK